MSQRDRLNSDVVIAHRSSVEYSGTKPLWREIGVRVILPRAIYPEGFAAYIKLDFRNEYSRLDQVFEGAS